jgi:hypothetical protein
MRIEEQRQELVVSSKNAFPDPLKAKCFKCKKTFFIKFVIPQQNYSRKNSWNYWTGKEENKDQKICNSCLRELYYDKPVYWETVKDLRKRNLLRSYIYDRHV